MLATGKITDSEWKHHYLKRLPSKSKIKPDSRFTYQYFRWALRLWLVLPDCQPGQKPLLPTYPVTSLQYALVQKNSCVSTIPKLQVSEGCPLCQQLPASIRKPSFVWTACSTKVIFQPLTSDNCNIYLSWWFTLISRWKNTWTTYIWSTCNISDYFRIGLTED